MSGRHRDLLKIEYLPDGDGSQYLVRAKKEIQFILHEIARKGTRSALYYGTGNDFILTTLLRVNEQGVWLEAGPDAAENRRIPLGARFVLVSSHQQMKVQFVVRRLDSVLFEHREAFYLPLPEALLRLQRREYYRMRAPTAEALKCAVPLDPGKPGTQLSMREMQVMDISLGGVALLCAEGGPSLRPGETYHGCRIALPGGGMLIASIYVQYVAETAGRYGGTSVCAGCEFTGLDGAMAILLQHYITMQQARGLARP
jgi:c-di-GMP-binding flagellar brake protein YcgR